jgi:hypothetical protein
MTRIGRLRWVLLVGGIAAAGAARAGDDLSAERPDFTNSPVTVARGTLQLEGGTTLSRDAYSVGELLARYGVASVAELRFGAGYAGTRARPDRVSGFQDLSLGVKVALRAGSAGSRLPAIAVIAETTAPTGSRELRARRWQPDVNLCMAWDLSPSVSLGTSQILGLVDDGQDAAGEWTGSVSLDRSFGSAVGGFLEYYGIHPLEGESGALHVADTGIAWGLGHDAQLDARVGTQFSEGDRPAWFVGVGGARRW